MKSRLIRSLIKRPLIVVVIVLVFPILAGFIYALPLPQFVAIESGQFISYYAIAFGLIGSMFVYLDNQEKQRIAKEKDTVPDIKVKIFKQNEKLKGSITNIGTNELSNIMLYDEDLTSLLAVGQEYEFSFEIGHTSKDSRTIGIYGIDDLEVNESGFPSYFQLYAEDALGRSWNLIFERRGEQTAPEYPLSSIEVVTW